MRVIAILLLSVAAFAQGGMQPGPGTHAAAGGAASFGTIIQEVTAVYSTNCAFASPTVCTFTVSSTGSGHLLVVLAGRDNSSASEFIVSVTSGACSGSWLFPAGSEAKGTAGATEAAYCLSSASGVTSISVTWTNWQGRPVLRFYEISYTGTASLIDSSAAADNTNQTSPSGRALTLAGATAYTTCQVLGVGSHAATAITSPYNTDFLNLPSSDASYDAAFSCALNNSSGTAPTWTTANGTSVASAIAFGVN